jgi:hypothetical protein
MNEPSGTYTKGSWNRAKTTEAKGKFRDGHSVAFEERPLNGGCEHIWIDSDVFDTMETCDKCGRYRSK